MKATVMVMLVLAVILPLLFGSTPVTSGQSFGPASWLYKGASIPGYTADAFSPDGNAYALVDTLKPLGVNSIALIVSWYQDQMTSTAIAPRPALTVRDEDLARLIDYIHSQGMSVMLKPHLEVSAGGWRGTITPASKEDWFNAYAAFIQHYAEIAAQTKVEVICIGTEMQSMTTPDLVDGWQRVADAVEMVYARYGYDGKMTYAATMSEVGANIPQSFWDRFDFASVTVYPPLSNARVPTVDELSSGWQSWVIPSLRRLWDVYGKQVVFAETGYRSVEYTAISPWTTQGANGCTDNQASGASNGASGGNVAAGTPVCGTTLYNGEGQANAYDAFFMNMGQQLWMSGAYLWQFEPNQGCRNFESGEGGIGYTPLGKPASQVIYRWLGGTGSLPAVYSAQRTDLGIDAFEYPDDGAARRAWHIQTSGTVELYTDSERAPGSSGQGSLRIESRVPDTDPRYMQLVFRPCTGAQDWSGLSDGKPARALMFQIKLKDPYPDTYGGEVSVDFVDTNEQTDEIWQYSEWLPSTETWLPVCFPLDPDPSQLSPWTGGITVPEWQRSNPPVTNLKFEMDNIREVWLTVSATKEDAQQGRTDMTAWIDDMRLVDTIPAECVIGTVNQPGINLRSGPGTQYGVVGTVTQGARLPILGQPVPDLGEAHDWYKVQTSTGDSAWVWGQLVTVRPNIVPYIREIKDDIPTPPTPEPQPPGPCCGPTPTLPPSAAVWIEGLPARTGDYCLDFYIGTQGLDDQRPYVTVTNKDGTWEQPGVTPENPGRWKSNICLGRPDSVHTVTVSVGGIVVTQDIFKQ